jgi:hypothetical protein
LRKLRQAHKVVPNYHRSLLDLRLALLRPGIRSRPRLPARAGIPVARTGGEARDRHPVAGSAEGNGTKAI